MGLKSTIIFLFLGAFGTAAARPVNNALPDTVRLTDIDVTAMKDVGTISTSLNRHEAELLRIEAPKNISQIAPNLFIPDYGSRMTSSIYVRGSGTRIDQPVIGLYVDNIPILDKNNYDVDMPDIDRITVSLGPQSTLFGRNAMNGIINVTTISPLNYQGLKTSVAYSTDNTIRVSLGYYAKPSKKLGMSVAPFFTHTDGQYVNSFNNSKCGKENQGGLRWRTEWRGTDGFSVGNNFFASYSRTSGYPYEFLDTKQINYNDTCFYRRAAIIDGISLKWVRPRFIVSSMTSVQYINDNVTLDQDFLPQSYFTLTQKRRELTFTEDAVAKGSTGNYTWLAGLFTFYRHARMEAPVTFKDYGIQQLILSHVNEENPNYPTVWDEPSFVLGSKFKTPAFNIGIYHESEYSLGDLKFTAGLRLDYERSTIDYNSECHTSYTVYDAFTDPSNPVIYANHKIDINDSDALTKSYIQLLPKAAVTYRFGLAGDTSKKSLVRFSFAKGYKAGGFNTQMFSDVLQQRIMGIMGITETYKVEDIISYKPETSFNYELGTDIHIPSLKLNTSVTLFHTDVKHLQLTVFPDGLTTGRLMTNAGSSRANGVEISTTFEPVSQFSLRAAWGFTDSRFRHYDNGKSVFDGKFVPYAPRHTIFASAEYRQPLSSKSIVDNVTLNVNWRSAGKIYWNEENDVHQKFYSLLGASMSINSSDFSVSIWGENLFNIEYNSFYFVSIGHTFLQRGRARQVGVSLKININKHK